MKMLLFIYLRWGRKFGGIWVIDSSEMKENAAVVRKQLQNSSENTDNNEYNQLKLRIVLLSYSRLLLVPAARHVHCKRGSLDLVKWNMAVWTSSFRPGLEVYSSHCSPFFISRGVCQRLRHGRMDRASLIGTIVTPLEILIILKSLLAKCIFNGTRFDWFHFWLLE